MATFEELLRVKEKHTSALLSRQGVHAVGVGLKERGGKLTDELAIVCYVNPKLDVAKLNPEDVVPRELDGVPTDVQARPALEPFVSNPSDLQKQVRPLAGGLQLQVDQHYGTLGFVGVSPGPSGLMVAVSNQHVLAPVGVTVFQPVNAKHNDTGTTTLVVLSPDVDGGYTQLVTTTGVAGVYQWNGNGYSLIPVTGSFTPTVVPYPVWKTGRTTGTTYGNIVALHVSGRRTDNWNFVDQMFVDTTDHTPFSLPGDSGSAILDSQNRVVGLLWGGDGISLGAGSPIEKVTAQLGITVATGGTRQLQQPVVVPEFDELLAGFASHRGKKIARFLAEHGPVIRDLIYTDYRVGVVWTHYHGHEICNRIIENVATKSTPLPATMAGAPTKHAFEQFGEVLLKRGSPGLRAAIEEIRGDIEWLIGRPYAEVAREV